MSAMKTDYLYILNLLLLVRVVVVRFEEREDGPVEVARVAVVDLRSLQQLEHLEHAVDRQVLGLAPAELRKGGQPDKLDSVDTLYTMIRTRM